MEQKNTSRKITLRGRDGNIRAYTLVNVDDYQRLKHHTWCLDSKGYAYRHRHINGRDRPIRLHREIMGVTDPKIKIDHKDGNPLNNRRSNLRVGSQGLNQQNRHKRTGTSNYRGVVRYRNGKWMAQGSVDREAYYLGYFDEELDAARQAEAFRREHMPFAKPDILLDPVPGCCCKKCAA